MTRLTTLRRPLRPQRGTVARGVMVVAGLVTALLLQSTTPAWQSRLDAAAAFIGVPNAQCAKASNDASTSGHPAAGSDAAAAAAAAANGWHDSKDAMVVSATSATAAVPMPASGSGITPAI